MREILFRGKKKNKEWIYGYLSSSRTISITTPCGNWDEIVVEQSTVGQYIGLDKNGTKIFEGDIVQWETPVNTYIQSMVSYKAEQSAFCIYIRNIGYVPLTKEHVEKEDFSLIGNFYDNPELIR